MSKENIGRGSAAFAWVCQLLLPIATGITTVLTIVPFVGPHPGRFVQLSESPPKAIRILDTVTGTVSACNATAREPFACTEVEASTDGSDKTLAPLGVPQLSVTPGPGRVRLEWTFRPDPRRPVIEWQYRLDGERWIAADSEPTARALVVFFPLDPVGLRDSDVLRRSIQIRGVDSGGVGLASDPVEFDVEPAVDYSRRLYDGPFTVDEVAVLQALRSEVDGYPGVFTREEAPTVQAVIAWIARSDKECQFNIRAHFAELADALENGTFTDVLDESSDLDGEDLWRECPELSEINGNLQAAALRDR